MASARPVPSNASGAWQIHRISREVGETSIQIDQGTGRVHLVVSAKRLRYYTLDGGHWTGTTIDASCDQGPLLRLDPARGRLLLVCLRTNPADQTRIYAMTKP